MKKEKVVVLMSTYNGEKYLEEQIESLLSQKNVCIEILVRDDGSSDNTLNILKKYKAKQQLNYYIGKNVGPARSFMDLIYHAPKSDYYALCDQDDIWLDDKLIIAVNKLKKQDNNLPALYYGKPRLVDKDLNRIKGSIGYGDYMTTFAASFINSNAIGCTFVFNNKLLCLIKNSNPNYLNIHDAWIHKVNLAVNGRVLYDHDVHMLYRQHSNNTIGSNPSSLKKVLKKFKNSRKTRGEKLNTIIELMDCYGRNMSFENRELCNIIINYKKSIRDKFRVLLNNKIKTKYKKRNIHFKLLILFNLY